jgi:hypothetical protein
MPRGPKSEKRPADAISNAVHVMRIDFVSRRERSWIRAGATMG